MDAIGYSTGALARSDVHAALDLLAYRGTGAVELSALRAHELAPLLQAIPALDLGGYEHLSVHAPSAFTAVQECEVAAALLPVARAGWRVVVHPDTLRDVRAWRPFGEQLCIENMDVRKPLGRTVQELLHVFARLPRASFCFDVAHAAQCDPSMGEAFRLQAFGDRLAEVHVSELDAHSRHVRLSRAGIRASRQVAELIPAHVPAIIEAPVRPHEIDAELEASLQALGRFAAVACAA
jgi:hypothetical protein